MKKEKRRRRARIILVVIIVVAVVVCYVLPLATLSAAAGEPPTPPGGEDEFGTDDQSLWPPDYTPPPDVEEKPRQTVKIINPPTTLDVGSKGTFNCLIENAPEGTYPDWSSSDSSKIIVDDAGNFEVLAPGDVEILVTAGGMRAAAWIHVNDLKANRLVITVQGIEPDSSYIGRTIYKISVSDVIQLRYDLEPKGANVDSINWSLSNSEIAELSSSFSNTRELIATAAGELSVTVSSGALSDTAYFVIQEGGIAMDALVKYIILIIVIIIVIVVVATLIARAVRIKKEEERKRVIAARRKKEAARQRAEEARQKAADEAEMAARMERNQQVLDMETTAHRSAKVSGATVSAMGDANKPNGDGEERPLTLDDIK